MGEEREAHAAVIHLPSVLSPLAEMRGCALWGTAP